MTGCFSVGICEVLLSLVSLGPVISFLCIQVDFIILHNIKAILMEGNPSTPHYMLTG